MPNLVKSVSTRFMRSDLNTLAGAVHSRNASGISAVELLLAAPVLLLVGLGGVQIALGYHAKLVLNYATVEAARTGAVTHAQIDPMHRELAYRLAPVTGGDGSRTSMQHAIAASVADAAIPSVVQLEVLNPTAVSFAAWGELNPESGLVEIPNHHLQHQDPAQLRDGQSLHDANILHIRSTYAYPLRVPLAAPIILAALRRLYPENSVLYAQGRVPILARATVRMQSTARQNSAMATDFAKAPPAPHTDIAATASESTLPESTAGADSSDASATDTSSVATDDATVGDSVEIDTADELPLCDEYGLGPLLTDVGSVESHSTPVSASDVNGDRGASEGSCGVEFPGAASAVAGPASPVFGKCAPAG